MPQSTNTQIGDLAGTRALVTGASGGIGGVIAARLARAGAEVVMPVRNTQRGEAALQEVRRLAPGANVSTRELDLSSLQSIDSCVAGLVAEGTPVGILVNNAALILPPERRVTEDGFEIQFGTNFLGHAALTLGLLPLLRAEGGRVTHQLSLAARTGTIDWDDLNSERDYDAMRAYGRSKLASGLFARALDARSRAEGWGITSNMSHPGVAPTNLPGKVPAAPRDWQPTTGGVINALSKLGIAGTVESAAQPALIAATGPDSSRDQLFGPKRMMGGPPAQVGLWKPLRSEDDARRMWDAAKRLIAVA